MMAGGRWKKFIRLVFPEASSDQNSRDAVSDEEPSKTRPENRVQLVMGIDFGTAYTKVVIGETRARYAVPYNESQGDSNPYLLASQYFVDRDGVCTFVDTGGKFVSGLKMRVLDNECKAEDEKEITAFLALVMRYAREWLYGEYSALYGRTQIDWLINIGVPTEGYHNEELVDLYRHMAKAAWSTSNEEGPVTLSLAEDWLVEYTASVEEARSELLPDDAVALFPEFVAQITGYVRSRMKRDDLHLLVDVGAGTIDISVFLVTERDGTDHFPILARSTEKLGSAYLMRARSAAIKETVNYSDADPVPTREALTSMYDVDVERLAKVDREFYERVFGVIRDCLRYTRTHRYRESRRWEEGVPTILCGGGSRVDVYQDVGARLALMNTDAELRKIIRVERMSLTMPEGLVAPLVAEDGLAVESEGDLVQERQVSLITVTPRAQ